MSIMEGICWCVFLLQDNELSEQNDLVFEACHIQATA